VCQGVWDPCTTTTTALSVFCAKTMSTTTETMPSYSHAPVLVDLSGSPLEKEKAASRHDKRGLSASEHSSGGGEGINKSIVTVSTLVTSVSMLSMATVMDESDDLSVVTAAPLQKEGAPLQTRSVLKVRTLSDSLKTPDISHSLQRRSVGFDTVEIREYGLILGWYVRLVCHTYSLQWCIYVRVIEPHIVSPFLYSNPAVRAGPPTTIEWASCSTSMSSLESYETTRPPRRSILFLRTTQKDRRELLKGDGYTSQELLEVESEMNQIQLSRKSSAVEKSDLAAMMAASKQKQRRAASKPKKGILAKLFGGRRR